MSGPFGGFSTTCSAQPVDLRGFDEELGALMLPGMLEDHWESVGTGGDLCVSFFVSVYFQTDLYTWTYTCSALSPGLLVFQQVGILLPDDDRHSSLQSSMEV